MNKKNVRHSENFHDNVRHSREKKNPEREKAGFRLTPGMTDCVYVVKYKYYIAGIVAVITFILYLSALQNAFVAWDDDLNVFNNPYIRSLNLSFFKWAFLDLSAPGADYWRPLSYLSHALDYAVWGLNPMGHHLTNNIIHTVNTFLVVLLVVKLMEAVSTVIPACPESFRGRGEALSRPKKGRSAESPLQINPSVAGMTNQFSLAMNTKATLITAAATGLLFGIHPLHVESVAWVSERKDLLCALFFLLSIMMYLSYMSHKTYRTYLLSLAFFALALLSKPMAVTLPLVLLIIDWYPFRRIISLKTFRSLFTEKIPFIALSIVSSILTILAQREVGAIQSLGGTPLSSRSLVAAKSIVTYLWKIILPVNLVPYYPYSKDVSLASLSYLSSIIIVAAITIVCAVMAKKQKIMLSVWGYYVATLIPVLGIVQVGGQSMADRYTYLPSLGPFLMMGLLTAWIAGKMNTLQWRPLIVKFFGVTVAVLVFGSLSFLTLTQIKIWENSFTLWTHVIEKEPQNVPIAYYNLGVTFENMGQFDKAIEYYNKAIAVHTSYFEAYINRGVNFDRMNQFDKAIEDYNQAVALNPTFYRAYAKRAETFEKMGLFDKAFEDYNKAIILNPSDIDVYIRVGVLSGKSGSLDKAIEHFNKAIDIDPDSPLAYSNRGFAYSLDGQHDNALIDFTKAIELNQNNDTAYFNRGNIYLKTGNKELAVSDFRKACNLGSQSGCSSLQAASAGK